MGPTTGTSAEKEALRRIIIMVLLCHCCPISGSQTGRRETLPGAPRKYVKVVNSFLQFYSMWLAAAV